MKPTISFYTFGCRLNQSETAVIERTFEEEGYGVVSAEEPADIAVINTCTVTENGDTDTRRRVNKIVRQNPNVQIALVGCQAQIQKNRLAALPNVRWIVGNAKKMELKLIIEHPDAPIVTAPSIPKTSFTMPLPGIDRHHTRANLKIQDGCDFFCSFCEIPYARGRARSREFEDILKEAQALVAAGHKELVITGINVGTYRMRIPLPGWEGTGDCEKQDIITPTLVLPQNRGGNGAVTMTSDKTILDVISAIEQIKGLERIRISSIEPTTIPWKLIEKMADSEHGKLCRYLHIPLQSASSKILKAMKRRYTFEEFLEFVERAHKRVPGICVGTDVIAGFPGETDEDFQMTAEALRQLPIRYAHVFSYSARHLAKSKTFDEPVPSNVIAERSRILRDISRRKRRLFYESFLGTTQAVLFEQKKNGFWTGLTDNYVRVHVRSGLNLRGQFRKVRLDQINGQVLLGTTNK